MLTKRNQRKPNWLVVLEYEGENEAGDEREELFDDDWKRIQRIELDRVFGAAAHLWVSRKMLITS